MASQFQVTQLFAECARNTVDEKHRGCTSTRGACLAPNFDVAVAGEVYMDLPSGFDSPMAINIFNVEFNSGETKLRASSAKQVPTLPERQISVDFEFEFFQGELCAEYAADGSAEDHSFGDTEFGVSEMLHA